VESAESRAAFRASARSEVSPVRINQGPSFLKMSNHPSHSARIHDRLGKMARSISLSVQRRVTPYSTEHDEIRIGSAPR
jgi:hypothetical protein